MKHATTKIESRDSDPNLRKADLAMDKCSAMAYAAYQKYLDADPAYCGPAEDYIAESIRSAVSECADIADECTSGCWADGAREVAAIIRKTFGLPGATGGARE